MTNSYMRALTHIRSIERLSAMLALSASVMAACLTSSVQAASAETVDFTGKRINAIIGYPPGGGTDAVTRLLGRFMREHMPGKPTMVYRNIPAGRGTGGAEYVAHKTPKNGLYWYAGANNVVDGEMLRRKEVNYDPRTFNFIGGFDRSGSLILMRAEKRANFKNSTLPPVIIGTADGSDTWGELLVWGKIYLGWNIKFVIGYPGTASLLLAIQRGEIEAFGTSVAHIIDELLVTQKGYAAVSQIGSLRGGKVISRIGFENVPTLASEIEGKLPDDLAKQAFRYWTKSNEIDKFFFIAPGTPKEIIAVYRDAFDKTAKDPNFMRVARKQFGPDFGVQSHVDITDMVSETAYPDEKVLTLLRNMKVKVGLPTEPLTQEEKNRLIAKLGLGKKIKTTLAAVKKGGRVIEFIAGKDKDSARVSSSNTKVMIGGKSARRGELKPGMACEVEYASSGDAAMSILCK